MLGLASFTASPLVFYSCRIFPYWHFVLSPSDSKGSQG